MAPERGGGATGGRQGGRAVAPGDPYLPLTCLLTISNSMLDIKEGDRAVDDGIERPEDDDLTSLTWLQDRNLLKGINLRTNGGNGAGVGKQESPTSDYVEDCPSEQSESTCSSQHSSSPVPHSKNKHPHHIPYDPKVHVTSKPPYSFSCLIFMSIEDSEGKALPVKEIYSWILEHFPYYRNAPTGWKNSVRHNLSLNKCFRKVDKAPNLGKGSLWMVDPVFRPNLVQALMKAPYHPYTNIERSPTSCHRPPAPHHSCEIKEDVETGEESLSSSSSTSSSLEEIDDVDAATAMLVLKHGPHARLHISQRKDEYHKRKLESTKQNDEAIVRREDHTYSAESSTGGVDGHHLSSPDEAFNSDSNSSWCRLRLGSSDAEERRKTAEGADALLNLAGIRTTPPPPPLKRPRLLRRSKR